MTFLSSADGSTPRWPTRRTLTALGATLAVFAAYFSFIPFRFQPVALHEAVARFGEALSRIPARTPRTDFGANVFFFVFVGASFCGAFSLDRRVWLRIASALGAVAFVVALSLSLEFGQVFFRGRVVSALDVVANSFGGALGVLLWLAAGQTTIDWIRTSARRNGRASGRLSLLKVYVVGLFVLSLLPFDVTFDLGQLASKYRAGRIQLVPFSLPHSAGDVWWEALWTAIVALPIGLLTGSQSDPRGRPRPSILAVAMGVGILALIELAQVFVYSRFADIADVLVGSVGVAMGAVAARTIHSPVNSVENHDDNTIATPPYWIWALALWMLVVVSYHWYPFDFALDAGTIEMKLRRLSLLPFAMYARGSPFNAVEQSVSRFALAVPLGIFARYLFSPGRRDLRVVQLLVFSILAFGLFFAIEAGQILLPTRTPDSGDALLGAFGAILGFRAAGR